MFACALEMFETLWATQGDKADAHASSLRKRIDAVEKSISGLLDRIVETTNASVVARYEQRIAEMEREKFLLLEKLEKSGERKGTLRDNFQLAFSFLSNPWKLWESERLEHKRMVLKLTFANRIAYRRKSGFSNPETSSVFKALGAITTQNAVMAVRAVGGEPASQ